MKDWRDEAMDILQDFWVAYQQRPNWFMEELLEVLIDSVVEDDDYIFFELVDTIPDDLRRLDSTMYERTKEDAQRLYEALSVLY